MITASSVWLFELSHANSTKTKTEKNNKTRHSFAPLCSYCTVSRIRRGPEALYTGVLMQRCGGGSGDGGCGGSAAAKTKQLGYHDQDPKEELVPHSWEVGNGLSPGVT